MKPVDLNVLVLIAGNQSGVGEFYIGMYRYIKMILG